MDFARNPSALINDGNSGESHYGFTKYLPSFIELLSKQGEAKLAHMSSDAQQPKPKKKTGRISIMSILVVTAVFGASAASLGHLYRAAQGDKHEIGQFVIVTAMLPLVVLVGASWFFKIFGRFIK